MSLRQNHEILLVQGLVLMLLVKRQAFQTVQWFELGEGTYEMSSLPNL